MRLRKLILTLLAMSLIWVAWLSFPDLNPTPLPDIPMEGLHPLVQKRIEESVEAVREAPETSQAWGELGMVLIAHDLPDAARQCLLEASQLDPEEFRWPYLIGNSYAVSDLEIAVSYYRQALEIEPGYLPLSLRLSQLLIRLGKIEEASEILEAARKSKPRDPYLLVSLGRLLLLEGETATAQHYFEMAVEQPGWMPIQAVQELLKLAKRNGDYQKAAEYQVTLARFPEIAKLEFPDPVFEKIRELEGLSKSEAEQADFALARGDIATAISLYESLVAKRNDLPTALTNLANAYGMSGRYHQAIATYERVLAKFHDYIPALMGLAATLNLEGQTEPAIEQYQRVIELKPDHKQAWFQLGMIYNQNRDFDQAIRCYRQAISVDPSFAQAQLALGILLSQKEEYEAARKHIYRATELAPGDPTPVRYLEQIENELKTRDSNFVEAKNNE